MYQIKKRSPTQKERQKRLAHLLTKTVIDDNGCMIWTGHINKKSGIATVFNFTDSIHRHIFRLSGRRINKKLFVGHSCKNSLCINPDHLVPIVRKEMMVYIAKQSANVRTQKANLSIVTDEIIGKVLELARYGVPYKDIAERFNITRHRVNTIALSHGIRRNKPHGKNCCEINKTSKEKKDISRSSKIEGTKSSETCCQENIRIAQ